MLKNITCKIIFTLMIVSVMLLVFRLIYNHDSLSYLIWNGPTVGIMPDLFETIWHAHLHYPYLEGAIYPPLCYFVIDFFNLFLNEEYIYVDIDYDRWHAIDSVSTSMQGLTVAAIYSLAIVLATCFMIHKYYNGCLKDKLILMVFFFGSAPFLYMYERGNIVIITMLLLAVFFAWYDADTFFKVRIALVCLAAAICLKIYPLIASILLLSEKKYKLICEFMLYTLILFFLPFLYTGGIMTFFDMIDNIIYLSNETVVDSRDFGYGFKVSLQNSLLAICDYCHITNIYWIKNFVNVNLLLLLISAVVLNKVEYRILAITLIMVLIPPFSWIYNVIYLLIPCLLFLNIKNQDFTKIDMLFIILIFGAFVPLPYGNLTNSLQGVNKVTLSTFLSSFSLYSMAIILEYETIKSIVSRNPLKPIEREM